MFFKYLFHINTSYLHYNLLVKCVPRTDVKKHWKYFKLWSFTFTCRVQMRTLWTHSEFYKFNKLQMQGYLLKMRQKRRLFGIYSVFLFTFKFPQNITSNIFYHLILHIYIFNILIMIKCLHEVYISFNILTYYRSKFQF